MSWDDDFQRELQEYSEIESVPESNVVLPKTIQRYNQRIQSNNTSSIFDADHLWEESSENVPTIVPKKTIATTTNNKTDEDCGVFKDQKVTYVMAGRGRGGRNVYYNPGEMLTPKILNGDDEIRQQIRKVAPIGYSNEITESAIRAHKIGKVLDQNGNASKSPLLSKSNSPMSAISIENKTNPSTLEQEAGWYGSSSRSSTPALSATSAEKNKTSPFYSKTKHDDTESFLSSDEMQYLSSTDVPSSEYFTSAEHNLSQSTSPSSLREKKSDESKDKSSDTGTFNGDSTAVYSGTSKGAIPKRPVPLSVILKQSRDAHRKKQLQRTNRDEDIELASERKIVELLRQDRLEMDLKRNTSSHSSSSSVSSRDNALSWRQRNNSPPRYAWGKNDWRREKEQLNIYSIDDFPALD